jgi:hydrogenase maturation protein HypF
MNAYEQYKRIIGNMTDIFQFKPRVFVHDLNYQYLSSRYAMQQQEKRIAVQHHHAHMASCMVEHSLFDKVIGVIFDGTGLGKDGSIWGGEFFVGDRRSFERAGHLKPVLLQGGDMAALEPWRSAVCYLLQLGYDPKDWVEAVDISSIEIVRQALASSFNCHLSSSMGRLFDCAASIIGIRQRTTYDAQAAIELENVLDSSISDSSYYYSIKENNDTFVLDFADIINDLLTDKKCNTPASIMSARFHNTISKASVDMLLRLRNKYQINNVVLSGGVFENIYLLESLYQKLECNSFIVYFNQQIPINDGGVSIGQLSIANEFIRK